MTESNVPPPPPPGPIAAPDYANATTDIVAPASKDEQNMGLLMFILGIFTGFLGPLILWLVKKDQSRYIDVQGKEVLDWQITMVIAGFVCAILIFVLIGFFLIPVVILCNLIFMIMGAVTASKGQFYRFPFALRLLK